MLGDLLLLQPQLELLFTRVRLELFLLKKLEQAVPAIGKVLLVIACLECLGTHFEPGGGSDEGTTVTTRGVEPTTPNLMEVEAKQGESEVWVWLYREGGRA